MTFEEAVAFLDERIRHGIHPGLDRIAALMELLDHPQHTYPSVHITGTNGKFTVAVMVSEILTELGLTVGTYTSPHVESIRERITVSGEPISETEFAAVLTYLCPFIEMVERQRGDHLTYFETVTAMAFERFFDLPVHAAVVEVGLGGEFDATNVIDARAAVITRIERDHIVEFGDDLARAAWEKAGIIKAGAVALSGVEQPSLREIVAERARERGAARVVQLDADFGVEERVPAVGGQLVRIRGLEDVYPDVFLPLYGVHAATNAALAVAAVEAFGAGRLDPEGVVAALGRVSTPGRIEVAGRRPLVVLDGGHNADATRAVVRTLVEEFSYSGLIVVLGMLEDKAIDDVASVLVPHAERFYATAPGADRAAPPQRVAAALAAAGAGPGRIEVVEGVPTALERATSCADADDLVLVFGSFYTVGEARSALRDAGIVPHP